MVTKPRPRYGWYPSSGIRDSKGLGVGDRVRYFQDRKRTGVIVQQAAHSRPPDDIVWKVDWDNGDKDYNQATSTLEPHTDT